MMRPTAFCFALCLFFGCAVSNQCKGRFYTLSEFSATRNWEDAKTICASANASLAIIPDEETQNFLAAEAEKKWGSGDFYAFIGSRREPSGLVFQWPDGTVFATRATAATDTWSSVAYTAWWNGRTGSGLCLQLIREDGVLGWFTFSCSTLNQFICMKEEPRKITFSQTRYEAPISGAVTIKGTISGLQTEPLNVAATYDNGKNISLAVNYTGSGFTYNIPAVTPAHFGIIEIKIFGVESRCTSSERTSLRIIDTLEINFDKTEIVTNYGEQSSAKCTVIGYTQPSALWFRNGVRVPTTGQISQTTRSLHGFATEALLSLTINGVTQSGSYECRATNWNGAGDNTRALQVRVPANIQTTEATIIANPSQPVTLDCFSIGNPKPTIAWQRNGADVTRATSSPVYQSTVTSTQFEARARLHVSSATVEQSGLYTCTGGNGIGNSVSSDITVYVPASISVSRAEVVAEQGIETTVGCTSEGNPRPIVNWYSGGVQVAVSNTAAVYQQIVSQSTHRTTSRLHLTVNDANGYGAYECRVQSNLAGPELRTTINVKFPANISLTSSTVHVNNSQRHHVDCVSFGFPKPNLEWTKNGRVVTESTSSNVYASLMDESATSQTLRLYFTIQNVEDSGIYTCQTTNLDMAVERTLQITIPINISVSETTKTTNIPDNFVITCDAESFPQPATTWMRNNVEVTTDSTVQIYQVTTSVGQHKSVSQLHVNFVRYEQAGQYQCRASNVDFTVRETFSLSTFPIITLTAFEIFVENLQRYEVTCSASGSPKPTLQWKKNNVSINGSQSNSVHTSLVADSEFSQELKLNLIPQRGQDLGAYICVATSDNVAQTNSTLLVKQLASVTLSQISLIAAIADNLTITCDAVGYPLPNVTWKTDNSTITSSPENHIFQARSNVDEFTSRSELSINFTRIANAGQFFCEATNNETGPTDRKTFSLHVFANISLSESVKTVELHTAYDTQCVSFGYPRPTVLWTRNGVAVGESPSSPIRQIISTDGIYKSSSRLDFTLDRVELAGKYECRASNLDTNVTRRLTLQVKPNISVSTTEVILSEGETSTIRCQSIGNPAPIVFWKKSTVNVTNQTTGNVYQEIVELGEFYIAALLHFGVLTVGDEGEYVCHASNVASGNSTISATATAKIGLTLVSSTSPPTFSQTQSFTCTFAGNYLQQVDWLINGLTISNNETTPTEITTTKYFNQIDSTLRVSSATVFGLNSTVECRAESSQNTSHRRRMDMNSGLKSANGTYYTLSKTKRCFENAEEDCALMGGYLPTDYVNFCNLTGARQSLWFKITESRTSRCAVFHTTNCGTSNVDCAKPYHYLCQFSALEYLDVSKCHNDRIVVRWRDRTANNRFVEYTVRIVNVRHSINVSRTVHQNATNDRIYQTTLDNLQPGLSYNISIKLFPRVWNIDTVSTTGMTLSNFDNVRVEMELDGEGCRITISLSPADQITDCKIRYFTSKVNASSNAGNWTERIVPVKPLSGLLLNVNLGENEQVNATYQLMTTDCRSAAVKTVQGECRRGNHTDIVGTGQETSGVTGSHRNLNRVLTAAAIFGSVFHFIYSSQRFH